MSDTNKSANDYFESGKNYAKAGDYNKAIADYSKCIELEPKDPYFTST